MPNHRSTFNSLPRDAQLTYAEMERAIRKIDRRIADLENFDIASVKDRRDSRISPLEYSLIALLTDIFGTDSFQFHNYSGVAHLDTAPSSPLGETPIDAIRAGLRRGIDEAIGVLRTIRTDFEENLEDAGRSSSIKPLRAYEALELHPEIERQIGQLYRDGHYAEAVEKSVKVLNGLVRLRSGEELDGTALMQKVFNKNNPILKFNSLADQSDFDEQQGFMYLFTGAVMGLRNPRAHRLISDDAERALEFIALVSLLAKMLDSAK